MYFQLVGRFIFAERDEIYAGSLLQKRILADLGVLLDLKKQYTASYERKLMLARKVAPFPEVVRVAVELADETIKRGHEIMAHGTTAQKHGFACHLAEVVAVELLCLSNAAMRVKRCVAVTFNIVVWRLKSAAFSCSLIWQYWQHYVRQQHFLHRTCITRRRTPLHC